ncbi:UNVERIFIED_CONTAM: hypothetical protein DES50_10612 [Williamsia faeni]
MYVSHDRRSDVTAATACPGSVVVGGWLLTMAAVAAFAFTTGDTLRDNDDAVLVSQAVASYEQSLSATGSAPEARPTSTHVVKTGVNSTTAPTPGTRTAAAPGGTCTTPQVTSTTGTVRRVSTRELASRSTRTHSGASISRISASACRVGASAKLNTAGVSSPAAVRSAGAARPAQTAPATN